MVECGSPKPEMGFRLPLGVLKKTYFLLAYIYIKD